MKLNKILGPKGWVNIHEGDDPWGEAHPTNSRHPLSHAFMSGANDLWLKQTGTPEGHEKLFDHIENLIKTHHPDWDEDTAHGKGVKLQMDAAEDEKGNYVEPGDKGFTKSWKRAGKDAGIHPDLVDYKLHRKVGSALGDPD